MPFAGGFIFIKPSPVSSKLPISPACGDPSPLLPVLFGQAVKTSAVPSVSAISAVVMSAVPVLLNSRFFSKENAPLFATIHLHSLFRFYHTLLLCASRRYFIPPWTAFKLIYYTTLLRKNQIFCIFFFQNSHKILPCTRASGRLYCFP